MNLSELRSKSGGFTLVELLVGILLSGIVLAGLYSVFISQERAFSAQERVAEMNQNIRAAMDLMTREIRMAGYRPATAAVETANDTTFRFQGDVDDKENPDGSRDIERVEYTRNADQNRITRKVWTYRTPTGPWGISGGAQPFCENATALSFSYTMLDGSVTSSPATLANIRKVTLSITARTAYPDPKTGLYGSITLKSDVTPRNLAS